MKAPPPPPARACGLDPGRVRVGVAVADELGMMAHPRGTLDARDPEALARRLAELVKDEGISLFVIGLPLDLHGAEGPSAREARRLASIVAERTGLPIEMWDERFTTHQAMRELQASGIKARGARRRIDEAAACAILQSWLDARRVRR